VKQAKRAAKQFNSRNEPARVAMARELRDRCMQAVERDPQAVLSLPSFEEGFRGYDVRRAVGGISGGGRGACWGQAGGKCQTAGGVRSVEHRGVGRQGKRSSR
jgi:hypothetical protein